MICGGCGSRTHQPVARLGFSKPVSKPFEVPSLWLIVSKIDRNYYLNSGILWYILKFRVVYENSLAG